MREYIRKIKRKRYQSFLSPWGCLKSNKENTPAVHSEFLNRSTKKSDPWMHPRGGPGTVYLYSFTFGNLPMGKSPTE